MIPSREREWLERGILWIVLVKFKCLVIFVLGDVLQIEYLLVVLTLNSLGALLSFEDLKELAEFIVVI